MLGHTIGVLTSHRQTRRQIARALHSGGITVRFLEQLNEIRALLETAPDLLILDCDNSDAVVVQEALKLLDALEKHPPLVLLSLGADKAPLLELVREYDTGNLVAKHGAIRAVYPVLDERELLVTCEKVIRRNIFGIDKYVGSWGVVLHRERITGIADKTPFLTRFEEYLKELDCPPSIVPGIVTVAEELMLNAVVHAPRYPDGRPKYEDVGLHEDLVLEPNEYPDIVYGCDGQRLMLSVSDNFGRLNKDTLYRYLSRGFEQSQIEAEMKASGAGLGLSMSFRSIHQLIFNIQDGVRTEVIAGWYLRVSSASEFRQVGKSFNLFWLPADSRIDEQARRSSGVAAAPTAAAAALAGRIDENTDFSLASRSTQLDLRNVTSITSRGLLMWLRFISSMQGKHLHVRAVPESIVRAANEVAGVLQGVRVETVLVPLECASCGHEENLERPIADVFKAIEGRCPECKGSLRFAGVPEHYQMFVATYGG